MKIFDKLKEEKTKNQLVKLLYAAILCLALLLIVEILFQIPAIADAFSTNRLSDTMDNNVTVWIILWLLMFAQVTIIPVPAMPIYVFCNNTYLVADGSGIVDLFSLETVFFVCFVTSACLAGAVTAYALGKFGGRRAVKWIAGEEEDYNKWSNTLNCKAGKYIYSATVILPIFPDDILCIVAGALKIDFKFFLISNIFGRLIGAFCMLLFLRIPYISDFFQSSANGGFPWALVVYSALLLICCLIVIIYKIKQKNKKKSS